MRHWSQLGMRNWRARPGRTMLTILAVTLGAAVVVWVTGCYESVRRSLTQVVLDLIGRAHVVVENVEGRWGLFSDSLVDKVAALPQVRQVTTRTMEWVDAALPDGDRPDADLEFRKIEMTGIDPAREYQFRTHEVVAGRMPAEGETGVAAAEDALAKEWKFNVGDVLRLRRYDPKNASRTFRVVGLVHRRRAAAQQLAMLWAPIRDVQSLCELPHRIKGLDIMLRDPSPQSVRDVAARITQIAQQHRKETGESLKVTTTEAQLAKLTAAQGLLRFILTLCACVLLLTAFFIIAATFGMGLVERVSQIGLLRCVGVTRRQAAVIVLLESLPIGVVGVLLGVPVGFLLQAVTIWQAGTYIGSFAVSPGGLLLAILGGLATAVFGGLGPAWRAWSVSPVEATRPLARPRRPLTLAFTGMLGILMLGGSALLPQAATDDGGRFDAVAIGSVVLLYAGYALVAPAVVVLLGGWATRIAGAVLRLRAELLGDEVTRAPWRSAAVCCGLMVGLSLIVGLSVWATSVRAGWAFPREFPEALVYSWNSVPLEQARAVQTKGVPGVRDLVIADDFSFSLKKPGLFSLPMLDKFSRFVAVDPPAIPTIISLSYLEGNERDALARMAQGGCVLVTKEFAQAQNKHLNDRITAYVDGKPFEMSIAGVIGSPAIDVAVSFFNASEYFQIYAVGAVIGSLKDAQERFGRNSARMFLFNFDLKALEKAGTTATEPSIDDDRSPDAEAGGLDEPADDEPASTAASQATHPWFTLDAKMAVATRQQQEIVRHLEQALGLRPGSCAFATAYQLKRSIDRNLNNVMLLLSSIPFMGLIVAALGLGNLMSANVVSRRREIAVLRALGTTRGQVLRMIVGEALILTLLGSAMGLLLGIHLGWMSNSLTLHLAGAAPSLVIPWRLVGLGAALATGLCILAGWFPARMASRASIVATLQGG